MVLMVSTVRSNACARMVPNVIQLMVNAVANQDGKEQTVMIGRVLMVFMELIVLKLVNV